MDVSFQKSLCYSRIHRLDKSLQRISVALKMHAHLWSLQKVWTNERQASSLGILSLRVEMKKQNQS